MSNRYITESIALDLLDGKDIVLISARYQQGIDAFEDVARRIIPRKIAKITRANGRQSLEIKKGGTLRLVHPNPAAGRGYSADIVVALGWNDLSDDVRQSIIPVLAATNGELIRF